MSEFAVGTESGAAGMYDGNDVAFRARALAQTHPLTAAAAAYGTWRVGRDAADHPFPEMATWAATAFLTGYCVRRVEESRVPGLANTPQHTATVLPLAEWEQAAARAVDSFTSNLPAVGMAVLLEHSVVTAALDDVIAKEVDKRREHVRDHVTDAQWAAFGEFIAWWVLHGYAIRGTEVVAPSLVGRVDG